MTPRQTLVVFGYLSSLSGHYETAASSDSTPEWHLSEGTYEAARNRLYQIESHILRVLGFQTHVALPYTLCINYLQTLDVFNSSDGPTVAKRAFAHLNTALLSPQLLYLTHQPSAIAAAAIYLATREMHVKLPEVEWWEVFDLDREELGFLVVGLTSVEGFVVEEKRRWSEHRLPLTVKDIHAELDQRRPSDTS